MRATQGMYDQTKDTYRRMAKEARYRPAAPSDGMGTITGPLNLPAEADAYARHWLAEEDSQDYWLGCPDFGDRPALVFIVEAARCLNGQAHEVAVRLLRMALAELQDDEGNRR